MLSPLLSDSGFSTAGGGSLFVSYRKAPCLLSLAASLTWFLITLLGVISAADTAGLLMWALSLPSVLNAWVLRTGADVYPSRDTFRGPRFSEIFTTGTQPYARHWALGQGRALVPRTAACFEIGLPPRNLASKMTLHPAQPFKMTVTHGSLRFSYLPQIWGVSLMSNVTFNVTLMGTRELRSPSFWPSLLFSPSLWERWTSQMLCLVNNALILGYEIKSLLANLFSECWKT